MKRTKKVRVIIDGNKHLCDIVVMPLHHGDNQVKISMANKLSSFKAYSRQMKPSVYEADLSSPSIVKQTPEGEQFEISYVFEKRLLKIKQEGGESSGINRVHFDVNHPINAPLFSLLLNKTNPLKIVTPNSDDIVIDTTKVSAPMIIVFSLVDDSGMAFMDPSVDLSKPGVQFDFELGEFEHKVLRIGVQSYNPPEGMDLDFAITVPHKTTKH